MILSDRSIRERLAVGDLVIEYLDPDAIQPASVDLRLEPRLRVLRYPRHPSFRSLAVSLLDTVLVEERIRVDCPYLLLPGSFVLGSTLERVEIPPDLVARLEGKSSLGRQGLVIHSTAGFVDPGFKGTLTLELSNNSGTPIMLSAGMQICQMSFTQMTTPADRPYGSPGLGSRYQGQDGPTPSRSQDRSC